MADVTVHLTDNSNAALEDFERQCQAALEVCGHQAVSHAKSTITKESRVDTGALRNSIEHTVQDKTLYVGTNVSYAIYNEMGTGIYAEGGNGRKSPWGYEDAQGNFHWTRGMKGIHFLKNCIANHKDEYRNILKQYLK